MVILSPKILKQIKAKAKPKTPKAKTKQTDAPTIKKKPKPNSTINVQRLRLLEQFIRQKGLEFKGEVKVNTVFETEREFIFDYYIESLRVAIEVNGGEWIGGRHNSGKGYQTDLEKSNLANSNGITYLQYTYSQLKKKAYEKDIKFLLSK